ncbi:MAG: hypothetical protein JWN80_2992 [Microbacteriaceae bacterium]|nr:hypothetical protein [Microbacteriaceae bacterium]
MMLFLVSVEGDIVVTDLPYSQGELADRIAIEAVLARYVHALDRHEIDLLDDVFLPEAKFDLSSSGGPVARWDSMKKFFRDEYAHRYAADFHLFSSIAIEFDQLRSTATSRSKVFNPRRLLGREPSAHEIAVGVYTDSWRKVADGWRIEARVWARALLIPIPALMAAADA